MTMLRSRLVSLLAIAGFSLALALAVNTTGKIKAATQIKNVVLIHGAWADGSSWSKLIPLLEAKELHVVAVQTPLTSLADDIATTRRAIALQSGPVVLVGHSYGGAVISEAGNDPKVVGWVYVAAFARADGESVASTNKPYPPSPLSSEVRPDSQGFLTVTAKWVRVCCGLHPHFSTLTPVNRDQARQRSFQFAGGRLSRRSRARVAHHTL
jgi:pimeloyl-ACP methyl ester carboxylesterase